MLTDTGYSPYAKVHGLPYHAIKMEDGFWKDCLNMCTDSTLQQIRHMFESQEISHVVENFRICAGESTGRHRGTPFGDGDFYKWLEAVLYCAVYKESDELFQILEEYSLLIAKAQRPDGYISTKQIIGELNGSGDSRQKDINEFEVYNFGHLFTLASLHKRMTGKDTLVTVAEKAAAYLGTLYEQAEKSGQAQTAVCPSHYMGLIELFRTTGKEEYKSLAQKAMQLRDLVTDGLDDNQDRLPVSEHTTIVGHAVRANYLYAGLADIYTETGKEEYRTVLEQVWHSLTRKKMYLTGGCGALYNGVSPYGNFFKDQKIHQAYGYEYQLPNITAYNETCASIGGVMWAYRMFTVEPRAEYIDVMERMMYNVNLAAISLDGKRFFYENMLRRTKELDYELVWPRERTEYIKSYCCPPNLARMLSQIGEYVYTVSEDSVWTCFYGSATADIKLENGTAFRLHQKTAYPYDGNIRFTMESMKEEHPWTLKLRIPGWTESGRITVNGEVIRLSQKDAGTYKDIVISHTDGTVVDVAFDMPVRLTAAHSMVEETEHHVAVERGPLVYCMESPDVSLETLDDLILPIAAEFQTEAYMLEGREVIALTSSFWHLKRSSKPEALYETVRCEGKEWIPVRLIPYFAWDNRGMGEMRIWFPAGY